MGLPYPPPLSGAVSPLPSVGGRDGAFSFCVVLPSPLILLGGTAFPSSLCVVVSEYNENESFDIKMKKTSGGSQRERRKAAPPLRRRGRSSTTQRWMRKASPSKEGAYPTSLPSAQLNLARQKQYHSSTEADLQKKNTVRVARKHRVVDCWQTRNSSHSFRPNWPQQCRRFSFVCVQNLWPRTKPTKAHNGPTCPVLANVCGAFFFLREDLHTFVVRGTKTL